MFQSPVYYIQKRIRVLGGECQIPIIRMSAIGIRVDRLNRYAGFIRDESDVALEECFIFIEKSNYTFNEGEFRFMVAQNRYNYKKKESVETSSCEESTSYEFEEDERKGERKKIPRYDGPRNGFGSRTHDTTYLRHTFRSSI
jgi:hypothetical protein